MYKLERVETTTPEKEDIRVQWNPFIKAIQNGGLSKEVACHEG